MNSISQFCQKCGAANDPQDSNCGDCGTRLMIVTFPKSLRHQDEIAPSYYEDHLLERISVLEFRVAQLAEQLAMGYEFISRQTKNSTENRLLMESFFESLEELKPQLSKTFAEGFSRSHKEKTKAKQTQNRKRQEVERIVAAHDAVNKDLFTHLIREGLTLLNDGEEKQAFKILERAILLSRQNIPLISFVAEKLFNFGDLKRAVELLESAYKISPQNLKILMLLGIINADLRKPEKARKFLSVLVGHSKALVCANYVWGMLAALEKNWREALAAFNQALQEFESPEIHYLIGCVHYELGNFQRALISLERAAALDANFADVAFTQSLTYEKLNDPKLAKLCRETAFETKETGSVCLRFLNGKKDKELGGSLAFLHISEKQKPVLTGGSLRMKVFVEELLSEVTG